MKNTVAKAAVLFVAGLVILSAAVAAQAGPLMRVNIPFAFLAGERMHQAGEYWVQVNSDFRYVELRPLDSAIAERVALTGVSAPRRGLDTLKGFLRFARYGSAYAMRAVGAPGAEAGLGVMPSKAEKELAKANGDAAGAEVSITQ